MTTINLKI